jgi:hypothetical protein
MAKRKRGLKASGKLARGCTYLRGGKIVCGKRARNILARRRAKANAARRRGRGRRKRGGGTVMVCYPARRG